MPRIILPCPMNDMGFFSMSVFYFSAPSVVVWSFVMVSCVERVRAFGAFWACIEGPT